MILRAFLIWILIALAEMVNGIVRVRLLNHRVGDRRARQIGVVTGSALILAIVWCAVPWIGARTPGQLLSVGSLWLVLMLAFDIAFGRLVFRAPWRRIAADFDLPNGGLLGLGMLFLFISPLLAAKMRGVL